MFLRDAPYVYLESPECIAVCWFPWLHVATLRIGLGDSGIYIPCMLPHSSAVTIRGIHCNEMKQDLSPTITSFSSKNLAFA